MMLTTKGRYAVMAIVDIAMQTHPEFGRRAVSLSDISGRQEITVTYLEQLFSKLRQAGIVNSMRGPGGGYVLKIPKEELTIASIIDAVEEPIDITRCVASKDKGCMKNNARCKTHDVWAGLEEQIHIYLSGITVAQVCEGSLSEGGAATKFMADATFNVIAQERV